MRVKQAAYWSLNAAGLICVIGLISAFALGIFYLSWIFALSAALCIEGRIHITGRLPRTPIFWVHLVSAVCFFILLTLLAFVSKNAWLEIAAIIFFIPMSVCGALLWYRGFKHYKPS